MLRESFVYENLKNNSIFTKTYMKSQNFNRKKGEKNVLKINTGNILKINNVQLHRTNFRISIQLYIFGCKILFA